MNYAYKKEEEKYIAFKTYLLTEAKLSELTANDYVRRLITICKENNIDYSHLEENIDTITYDYTKGSKIDLGKRSHNSYRSALLQFQKFVKNGGSVNNNAKQSTAKYHFEVYQVPGETFGAIKLYDENSKLIATNATLDKDNHDVSKMSRDMIEKCIKMMFDNVYNKDTSKLLQVLRMLECSLTVSGKKIIL